jgi:hypothetical protein
LCLEKPSRYGFSQGSPRNVIVSPLLTLEREPEIHLIDSNFARLIHAFMPCCYGELGFIWELGGEFFLCCCSYPQLLTHGQKLELFHVDNIPKLSCRFKVSMKM